MPKVKSELGRLRQRVGHTAQTAADAFGIPVRAIRNYEVGGGTSPRTLKEKIAYAEWLIRKAQAMNLPDIPSKADLLPDVYGKPDKENPRRKPGAHTEYSTGVSQWNRKDFTTTPRRVATPSGSPTTKGINHE